MARRYQRKPVGRGAGVPLYHQAYLVLRQELLEGRYPPGEAMPGEEPLRRAFGVSRVTIRKTLDRLAREGLVRRVRGSGTYPLPRPDGADARANISGLFENLVSVGLRTEARLVSFGLEAAPANLARQGFGLEVLKVVRVRSFRGEPFAYMVSTLPGELAPLVQRSRLGNRPLLLVLEKAGLSPQTANQALTATAATQEMAAALDVALGAPLIHMTRLTRDGEGRPIERFESFYRPDKYEYRLALSRGRSAEAPRWVPVGG